MEPEDEPVLAAGVVVGRDLEDVLPITADRFRSARGRVFATSGRGSCESAVNSESEDDKEAKYVGEHDERLQKCCGEV